MPTKEPVDKGDPLRALKINEQRNPWRIVIDTIGKQATAKQTILFEGTAGL
jgi:hypothetical protein